MLRKGPLQKEFQHSLILVSTRKVLAVPIYRNPKPNQIPSTSDSSQEQEYVPSFFFFSY